MKITADLHLKQKIRRTLQQRQLTMLVTMLVWRHRACGLLQQLLLLRLPDRQTMQLIQQQQQQQVLLQQRSKAVAAKESAAVAERASHSSHT
jgi:hypothetical protein